MFLYFFQIHLVFGEAQTAFWYTFLYFVISGYLFYVLWYEYWVWIHSVTINIYHIQVKGWKKETRPNSGSHLTVIGSSNFYNGITSCDAKECIRILQMVNSYENYPYPFPACYSMCGPCIPHWNQNYLHIDYCRGTLSVK